MRLDTLVLTSRSITIYRWYISSFFPPVVYNDFPPSGGLSFQQKLIQADLSGYQPCSCLMIFRYQADYISDKSLSKQICLGISLDFFPPIPTQAPAFFSHPYCIYNKYCIHFIVYMTSFCPFYTFFQWVIQLYQGILAPPTLPNVKAPASFSYQFRDQPRSPYLGTDLDNLIHNDIFCHWY